MRLFLGSCVTVAVTVIFIGLPATLIGQTQTNADRQSPEARASQETLIRALHAKPNQASLYEISFVTSDTLDAKGEIVIEFPGELDLSQLQVASSTTINGGFTLSRNGNRVRAQRTGLGDRIAPGKRVDLKLGIIKNPPALDNNLEVSLAVQASTKKSVLEKKNHQIQFISQ